MEQLHTYIHRGVGACVGPVQAQARTNAGVERRDGYRVPSLAKKLLTIDICWEE